MTRQSLVWVGTALLAAILVLETTAWAGTKVSYGVYIDTTSRYAQGALGTVRNSTDGLQEIQCGVWAYLGGGSYATCYARDASGNQGSCFTSAANLVPMAAAISGDSLMSFEWDASGNCTEIGATNGSEHAPKQP
jgi:hypothetical protein